MRLAYAAALLLALAAPARAQWTAVPLPPPLAASPSQVPLFGFATAFDGSLFASNGFGNPQTPSSPVYDCVFVTHDGGATWAAVPEFTFNITSSSFRLGRPTVADGALYLPRRTDNGNTNPAVSLSTVLRTTDGTAWTVPAAAGFNLADGVLADVARQEGVLYGFAFETAASNMGYLYRSPDEGATWARVGDRRVPGFAFTAGRRLVAGFGDNNTRNGEISADGAATWTTFGVSALTPGQRVLDVARSTDGVTLVGSFRSTTGGEAFAAAPAYVGHVTACGRSFVGVSQQGVVRRSDGGGLTWTNWATGLPDNGFYTQSLSCGGAPGGPVYVYATVVGGSAVYRRDLAQVSVAAEAAPGAEALMLSVGPNPARGAATLRVTLAEAQPARVTLTDVLGRDVLVIERSLPAGASSVPLDVSALARGVYAARLVAGRASGALRVTVAR